MSRLVTIYILTGLVYAADIAMSSDRFDPNNHYYLSIETRDSVTRVFMNHAPMFTDNEGEETRTTEPVNCWLMPGENTLELQLDSRPATHRHSSAEVTIKLFIKNLASDERTADEPVAELAFPGNEPDSHNLPATITVNFDSPYETPARLWEQAASVGRLTQEHKAELIAMINNLAAHLINGDMRAVFHLLDFKINDDALCSGKPVEKIQEALNHNYQWLNSQEGLKYNPLTIDEAYFLPCCDNKAIYIGRMNGDEAVILESNELYFDMPIFVARIKGKWKIVR